MLTTAAIYYNCYNLGTRGFGNARAVAISFAAAQTRQAARVTNLSLEGATYGKTKFLLTRDDILGPKPGDLRETSAAWQELNEMIGHYVCAFEVPRNRATNNCMSQQSTP